MPLSTREINNLKKDGKTQTIEDNTSVFVRSGLNKKQRTRVFGKNKKDYWESKICFLVSK